MAWIPHDYQQKTEQSGRLVAVLLIVVSVMLTKWLAFSAYAEYLIQRYSEAFAIAFVFEGHILLLFWAGFSLLMFLVLWGGYLRIRCWLVERRILSSTRSADNIR